MPSSAQSADVRGFFDPETFTITYLVKDPISSACAIVDSVLDYDPASGRTSSHNADRLIALIKAEGLQLQWLLETHVHADHLSAAPYIQKQLGGKIAIGEHITQVQNVFGDLFHAEDEFSRDGRQFDQLFRDGDEFAIGELQAKVIHTPGHTPACVSYWVEDSLFVGDTLFMPDYGTARCDFPGGDARTLYQSIQKLLSLPDQTRVFLCHDYLPEGREEYQWQSTIAEQRHNIHLAETSEAEFVAMRQGRDAQLSMPRLILPSVQINMRAGHKPPAEDNGKRYLKIPLDAL
ncbi:MBL fold metallo-hydrolase [Pseudoteredinibacter isoporae]|uniref:Glyoxylase-like metal-dependent hydrolase (Beta-lactamase superfamily II) n=1 Tax=Pseudoteredinibacter isoporae TaxID=570281 RepID=A0A7X0JXI9_9GAMM|nr:MBL fold metallo-hydrolase [Pseudoteredinibacter isoporae]MBB6523345.1 glyoxylase-like metal-dependent hydrolase (beta-lactamase superfamily II) [Pseudoteredinibacter isoporae]NHO88858.1 MBL fold metallo-hydrolase [Pseudoteredinibacter isoporae]NIB24434.1 MBL fold metallo-hydrolase [Pseudoteredinibacter isoporae]